MTKVQNKIDRSNLLQIIKGSPNQLLIGFELAKDIKFNKKFTGIVLNGMGGSALPAELIQLFLDQEKKTKPFTIEINRNYDLSVKRIDNNKLNIFSSYSGNTEETLSSLKQGLKMKLPIIIMASGGKLQKIAEKKNLPLIKIPTGVQPRMALGYTFGALLRVLNNLNVSQVKKADLESDVLKVNRLFTSFNKKTKEVSSKIKNKTPIVYSSWNWKSLAMIWKIMINENGKTPAFWNFFPELNHNEMVGFTKQNAAFHLLILKDSSDHPSNLKRVDLTEKLLRKFKVSSSLFEIPKGPTIFKIFASLQFGCLISYHLAIMNKEDPTPVKMVETFKKNME